MVSALGISALPATPDTIIAYLSELPTMPHSERHGRGMRKTIKTGYSVATITRRLATIASRHKEKGFEEPLRASARPQGYMSYPVFPKKRDQLL